MDFRTPKRRLTRQRSGNTVSGTTTGGECKIIQTEGIDITENEIEFNFKEDVSLIKSFGNDSGFIAFGGYIHSENDINVDLFISFESSGQIFTQSSSTQFLGNRWNKIGIHHIFDTAQISLSGILSAKLKIKSTNKLSRIEFFGFDLNSVDYYGTSEFLIPFNQQTGVYLPEIYYFNPTEVFVTTPLEYSKFTWTNRLCIYLKSCNRCARYLPIDFDRQDNDIAFSLHCKSRAPCTHSTFATYKVEQNDCSIETNENNQIQAYYGYQLECKSCKKFYVNWPLNPLRSATQHREDSLRRRAFEELVGKLIDKQWIFHQFRIETETEFDNYIFEKFNKKCFKCKKNLKTRNNMALDHTFPIAMLWPLDESATCLCQSCNSSKSDKFPVDFYNASELIELSKITGLELDLLRSRPVNTTALDKLKEEVVWFFDDFLMQKDYQKIREGKKVSDNVFRSLQDVIKQSGLKLDLVKEYEEIKKTKPKSITIV